MFIRYFKQKQSMEEDKKNVILFESICTYFLYYLYLVHHTWRHVWKSARHFTYALKQRCVHCTVTWFLLRQRHLDFKCFISRSYIIVKRRWHRLVFRTVEREGNQFRPSYSVEICYKLYWSLKNSLKANGAFNETFSQKTWFA